MHLSHVIATSVLLGTTNAAKVLPIHKRFSYDPLVNDFSYLGMLSKRDACSDAFGSSAHNSNCAPNFTLCCTRDGQSYPSCEKWLGKGWCCVGEGDNDKCYVDQASACNEQGAVQCKRLGSGTSKACCPRLTTCDDNTDATEQVVRCNIDRGVLIAAQSSSEAKTATTSTAVSSSTQPATSTTTSAPQTTAPESQTASPSNTDDDGDDDSTLSGGAIGGIVVGAVGGIGLIAGLAWFFMRRKKNKDAATPPQPTIAQYYDDQTKYQQQGYWPQGSPNPPYTYSSQPPSELGNNQVPVEMDGGYYQYQQQQQSPYQHQQSPIQHQQSPIQHQQSPIQHQSSPPPQQPSPFQQQHQQ